MKWLQMVSLRTIGIVVVVGLFISALLLVSVPPPTSLEKREYTYTPSNASPNESVEGASPGETNQCTAYCGANADSDEQQRNEFVSSKRDLNAQEGVWRASNAMAISTAIATVIGVVGVYLLRQTLVATSETLAATRIGADAAIRSAKAAEAAEGAHLFVTANVEFAPFCAMGPPRRSGQWAYYPNKEQLSLEFFIQNLGKTPARNIVCGVFVFWAHIAKTRQTTRPIDLLAAGGKALIHEDLNLTRDYIGVSANKRPIALVRMDYDDVFGSARTKSNTIFRVEFSQEFKGIVTVEDADLGNEAIVNEAIQGLTGVRLKAQYE